MRNITGGHFCFPGGRPKGWVLRQNLDEATGERLPERFYVLLYEILQDAARSPWDGVRGKAMAEGIF